MDSPSADEILEGLSAISNGWKFLAVLWHLYFAVLLGIVLLGWRPSKRLIGVLLAPPLVSVSVLAWIVGNPFNATSFALLVVVLIGITRSLRPKPISIAPVAWATVGAVLFLFAWIYPHFLEAESPYAYLFAAPLGLIPCPTLAMIIGLAIMLGGPGSPAWALALGMAGLFYGIFGSFYLGVTVDWMLAIGALCLLARVGCGRKMRDAGEGAA